MIRGAWQTGIGLAELKCHPGQLELFNLQMALPPHGRLFELCSRRWGKTWEEIVLLEVIARTMPKAVIRFAAPTKQQAREIILPNWQLITDDCPPELRAQDRTGSEGCYVWPTTGSRLYLAGTDDTDQIDRLRGPYAHLVIVDELGFHHCDLDRLIHSVLAPQLATTRGKLILSTTPPESMAHSAMKFIALARKSGWLVRKNIFDNPLLTDDDRRIICANTNMGETNEDIEKILKGEKKGTPAWEREYLCNEVSDDNLRVVREFDPVKHVAEFPRPTHFTPYTFLDIAFTRDNCAALFCFYDFRTGTLVVEDEWIGRSKSLGQLKDIIVSREVALFGGGHTPVRYGDGSALGAGILASLTSDFGLDILPCQQGPTKTYMINGLREFIGANRVKVNPRCTGTIDQLWKGVWDASKAKEDYMRLPGLGHLDALDALCYGVASVDWQLNPVPTGQINEYQNIVVRRENIEATGQAMTVRKMFQNVWRQ